MKDAMKTPRTLTTRIVYSRPHLRAEKQAYVILYVDGEHAGIFDSEAAALESAKVRGLV